MAVTTTTRRAPARTPQLTKSGKTARKKVRQKPKHKGRTGPLTREDKTFLRGLGHKIDPVIQVGHKGVTDTLIAETKSALRAHELIKVKLGKNAPEEVDSAAESIAGQTNSVVVQVIGGVVLLYKEPPDFDDRKIHVPGR